MMLDLLIKNGRVVDGSGQAAFYADVAVQDGKIIGVGKCNEAASSLSERQCYGELQGFETRP